MVPALDSVAVTDTNGSSYACDMQNPDPKAAVETVIQRSESVMLFLQAEKYASLAIAEIVASHSYSR